MMFARVFFTGPKARSTCPDGTDAGEATSLDQAEARNADHDQVNGDDVIEQPRHQQDQDTGQQCDQWLNVGMKEGNVHG
jgi:hypothetical protein